MVQRTKAEQARQDRHDDAWLLIPWYVNETLSKDEAELVEKYASESAAFRSEIANQRQLASSLSEIDDSDFSVEASWQSLSQEINGARTTPVKRDRGPFDRLWERLAGIRWLPDWRFPVGVAAGLALALAVIVPMGGNAPDQLYRTLTDAEPSPAATEFRVIFADGTTERALRDLLSANQLRIVDGPSERGVYVLGLGTDGNVADVSSRLSVAPEIGFVSVTKQQ